MTEKLNDTTILALPTSKDCSEAIQQAVASLMLSASMHQMHALLLAVWKLLAPRERRELIAALLEDLERAGTPVPPLVSDMEEANYWADLATRSELEAYACASVTRMPIQRQIALFEWLGRRLGIKNYAVR